LDNFSSGRIENIEHHKDNRDVEILKGDLKTVRKPRKLLTMLLFFITLQTLKCD
jgi:hypothetical protein